MRGFAEHLQQHGYARVLATAPDETTLQIARRLGAVSEIAGIAEVQQLTPRAVGQASTSSYGGMYGLDAFPLHTDMAHWYVPPRYFLLRCLKPAHQVETLALHFREILGDEDEVTLRRAIFRPRRRLEGRLTPIRLKEDMRYRWDPVFLVPVTEEGRRLRERVVQRISEANVAKVELSGPMDCILFDNWNVLHGRSTVPTDALHRRVERVYLESLVS